MISFDKLERRFGWLSFPGFFRCYALLHVLVFVLQMFKPDLFMVLMFDREKILSGEVWRVVTCFFASSEFGGPGMLSIVFLYFGVMFAFMINDGLESVWGPFKASLFYYAGIILILVTQFLIPSPMAVLTFALYSSAFLAFATVLPRVEILLFFILPVQVRWLGCLAGGAILLTVIREPQMFPYYLLAYANYLLWAGFPALRRAMGLAKAAQRRSRFNAANAPAGDSFHSCVVCDRTEVTDPRLEFRVGPDGREYCEEHLKN